VPIKSTASISGVDVISAFGPINRPEVRLLVVDPEESFRKKLADLLEDKGYLVEQVAGGKTALKKLSSTPFDGFVLNLEVPDLDGVSCMQEAHAIQPAMNILVVTTAPDLRSAIASIKAGVIDYLIKPVNPKTVVELMSCAFEKQQFGEPALSQLVNGSSTTARLINDRSLAPAAPPRADARGNAHIMLVPPLRLDHNKRLVTLLGSPERSVRLTRGETIVLASLMAYPDLPVSCQYLVRVAWQYELDAEEAGELIRPYIFRLRRKLEANPKDPQFILTMRGQGYMFASSRGGAMNSVDDYSI
jgi:DNA-binding response OmpR family regulator